MPVASLRLRHCGGTTAAAVVTLACTADRASVASAGLQQWRSTRLGCGPTHLQLNGEGLKGFMHWPSLNQCQGFLRRFDSHIVWALTNCSELRLFCERAVIKSRYGDVFRYGQATALQSEE